MSTSFSPAEQTTIEKTPMIYLKSVVGMLLMLCLSKLAHGQDQPAGVDSSQQGSVTSPSKTPAANPDDSWHADLIFYLWLAGVHGTIANTSQSVDFRASPTD